MKIKEIKASEVDLKKYKSQKCIRRSVENVGGFEKIVVASDEDLD